MFPKCPLNGVHIKMEKLIEILKNIPLPFFFLASLVAVLMGDFFAKFWSVSLKGSFFIIASIGYLLSGILYMPTLLQKGLVITATIWTILNIIGFLAIGFMVFKENITTLQTFGLALGVIAIAILSWPAN